LGEPVPVSLRMIGKRMFTDDALAARYEPGDVGAVEPGGARRSGATGVPVEQQLHRVGCEVGVSGDRARELQREPTAAQGEIGDTGADLPLLATLVLDALHPGVAHVVRQLQPLVAGDVAPGHRAEVARTTHAEKGQREPGVSCQPEVGRVPGDRAEAARYRRVVVSHP